MREPGNDTSLRLVVFGDSIATGSGASSPRRTLVGLAAAYILECTGRHIKIENYAIFGGTADMLLEKQLPRADVKRADVILLEIGANDSFKRTPSQYRTAMKQLLERLPLQKTVIADLPYVKLRQPYQEVLEELFANKKIIRATLSSVFHFRSYRTSLALTSGDFFHPNNKGHRLWFAAFKPGIKTILKQNHLLKTEGK